MKYCPTGLTVPDLTAHARPAALPTTSGNLTLMKTTTIIINMRSLSACQRAALSLFASIPIYGYRSLTPTNVIGIMDTARMAFGSAPQSHRTSSLLNVDANIHKIQSVAGPTTTGAARGEIRLGLAGTWTHQQQRSSVRASDPSW